MPGITLSISENPVQSQRLHGGVYYVVCIGASLCDDLTNILRATGNIGVQITPDEGARLDIRDSVSLPNNNLAILMAFSHNLHCLVSRQTSTYAISTYGSQRRIRQTYYKEHYYPNMTKEETERYRHHDCVFFLANFFLFSLTTASTLPRSTTCIGDVPPRLGTLAILLVRYPRPRDQR